LVCINRWRVSIGYTSINVAPSTITLRYNIKKTLLYNILSFVRTIVVLKFSFRDSFGTSLPLYKQSVIDANFNVVNQ